MLSAIQPYPNVVQEAARANYGPAVKRSELPLVTMEQTEGFILKDTVQQYDTSFPLEHDLYWGDMAYGGASGLGAEAVTKPVPQPVQQSTIYLVAGVAGIAVLGGLALWLWSRRS
jgi:hypothetical protein